MLKSILILLFVFTQQPGSVFKRLDAWRSEVIVEFPQNNSFNS